MTFKMMECEILLKFK